MATAITKTDLEARIAELEAILATSSAANENQVVLVGMLRAVKPIESKNPEAKFQVTAILTNNARELINGQETRVDLPVDGLIASDNGNGPLATQLLDIARSTRWARVRVTGFWVRRGEIELRNSYLNATGKQLRLQSISVLNSEPADQPALDAPIAAPFADGPTGEEPIF
jgi:hypothetical protein